MVWELLNDTKSVVHLFFFLSNYSCFDTRPKGNTLKHLVHRNLIFKLRKQTGFEKAQRKKVQVINFHQLFFTPIIIPVYLTLKVQSFGFQTKQETHLLLFFGKGKTSLLICSDFVVVAMGLGGWVYGTAVARTSTFKLHTSCF